MATVPGKRTLGLPAAQAMTSLNSSPESGTRGTADLGKTEMEVGEPVSVADGYSAPCYLFFKSR